MALASMVSERMRAYSQCCIQTLERALTDIPFYRAWRAFDMGGDAPINARFAGLPILTKADIRRHFPAGFVPVDKDFQTALAQEVIEYVETSGTTGEQVINIWCQQWWDASERASWQLHARVAEITKKKHREALLGSSLSIGDIDDDADIAYGQRVWKNYLFLNEKTTPLLWSARHYQRMIDELAYFQPDIVEGNPSYMWRLCRYAVARGIRMHQPKVVMYTYELPLARQMYWIQQAWSCPCVSSYGATELGYVFMECGHGRLHQNTQSCHVDFQPLCSEHGGPRIGRIAVTTLGNQWYQMMRFDPGDLVRVSTAPCPCGCSDGIVLDMIEGRFLNCTQTVAGRLVTPRRLDAALACFEDVLEYNVVQETRDTYSVTVCAQSQSDRIADELIDALQRVYGTCARIRVQYCNTLAPEGSGKFRHSRSYCLPKIEEFLDAAASGDSGISAGNVV